MISMPQVQSIRRLRRNGESVASIARKTHVSEPTVRKYLAKEDLSAVPSVRKPRASVIDPYLPVIEQWLAEDRANWRKQRWTGNGVLDRFLEDESLFGEFLRTPVSEGGVESLVVEPPHIVVEVGA